MEIKVLEKKFIIIAGTRPEAIKLAPLYLAMKSKGLSINYIATGQHSELHDQVTTYFNIKHFISLASKSHDGSLNGLCVNLLISLQNTLQNLDFTDVIVQGDTASAFCGAQYGFLDKKNVIHVEAGLRSFDRKSPFPEEVFRKMISSLADIHLCPTKQAVQNLINEGVPSNVVHLVGNTVVDSVRISKNKGSDLNFLEAEFSANIYKRLKSNEFILVTIHRRENHGENLNKICEMLLKFLEKSNVKILLPMHPNPVVKDQIKMKLSGQDNIILSEGLSYPALLWAMSNCKYIVSDSGGIQEEAPSFSKNILILRDETERREIIDVGLGQLIGTNPEVTLKALVDLNNRINSNDNPIAHNVSNPFGDGFASEKIIDIINQK